MKDNLFVWVAIILLAIAQLMSLSVLKKHEKAIEDNLGVTSSLVDLSGKIVEELIYQAHGGTYSPYLLNKISTD